MKSWRCTRSDFTLWLLWDRLGVPLYFRGLVIINCMRTDMRGLRVKLSFSVACASQTKPSWLFWMMMACVSSPFPHCGKMLSLLH